MSVWSAAVVTAFWCLLWSYLFFCFRRVAPDKVCQALASAASQAGLNWNGRAHSAVADAVMTVRVVSEIAEYWHLLQRELSDNS